MIGNKKLILTRQQKSALKKTKKFLESLKSKYGDETGRWAINRVMREDTQRRVLIRKKERVEEELKEIEEKLT